MAEMTIFILCGIHPSLWLWPEAALGGYSCFGDERFHNRRIIIR